MVEKVEKQHKCPLCGAKQIVFWDKMQHFECTNPDCEMYQKPYGSIG